MTAYSDLKRVLYSVLKPDRKSEIWLAALDHRFAPRRLSAGDDNAPRFGPDDSIFRSQARPLLGTEARSEIGDLAGCAGSPLCTAAAVRGRRQRPPFRTR